MLSWALHTKAARLASHAYHFVIFPVRKECRATCAVLRSDGQRFCSTGEALRIIRRAHRCVGGAAVVMRQARSFKRKALGYKCKVWKFKYTVWRIKCKFLRIECKALSFKRRAKISTGLGKLLCA